VWHLAALLLGTVPFHLPRPNNLQLTEVQIVGDSEWGEIPVEEETEETPIKQPQQQKQPEPVLKEKPREESSKEPAGVGTEQQVSSVQPEPEVSQKEPEQIAEPKVEETPVAAEPNHPMESESVKNEEIVIPESQKETTPSLSQPSPPHQQEQEPEPPLPQDVIVEEPPPTVPPEEVPLPEKVPEPPVKKEEPKKTTKNSRKALLETIKRAEKKKIREKNRQKILEMAEQASKKKKDNAFEKMLNSSIEDLERSRVAPAKAAGRIGTAGNGQSTELSVGSLINAQIRPYWNVPSGIKDAEKIVIEIDLRLDGNGEVIPSSVKIIDEKRYAMDYIFKAAADSARRAILEVGRFKIPREMLEYEKEYRLKFDVAEALKNAGG
jgi:hypothetical protein